ncbi:hypothetical protein ACFWC2_29235, partial [Streptomyces diastaticus]
MSGLPAVAVSGPRSVGVPGALAPLAEDEPLVRETLPLTAARPLTPGTTRGSGREVFLHTGPAAVYAPRWLRLVQPLRPVLPLVVSHIARRSL